jgi:hypothetical protein
MYDDKTAAPKAVLANFPAFRYSYYLGKYHFYLIRGQILLACIFALMLTCSALLDHTLTMTEKSVGFLQHPGIFIYLIAQCVLPYTTLKSIISLLEMPATASGVLSERMIDNELGSLLGWFRDTLLMRDNFGRISYGSLTALGFGIFVWNCYQNQLPLRFLGFDFWDSAYHPFGYWSTRIYKFYVAALLAPAIVHIQIALVITIRRILLYAARNGELKLEPYHPDGCGGVRLFIDNVLNPMVPILFTASAMTFAAFFVHKKYDITTVGGLLLTCALFLLIYLVPAVALRKAIVLEKKRQLSDIARRQGKFYSSLMLPDPEVASVKSIVDDLDSLSDVGKHIILVPNWPQFQRALKIASLAGSSPILSWAGSKAAILLGAWLGITI